MTLPKPMAGEPAGGEGITTSVALGYRPALDGLRAGAVLAVILYHLGAPWLPGGFLGVDFFFVLSGYLITGLLIRQRIETGSISMLSFYVRRIRRLLPALILMITAVTAWTAFDDNPISWAERRGDMIATLFYYANWHQILSDQSYFAQYSGSRRFATRGRWLLKSSTI